MLNFVFEEYSPCGIRWVSTLDRESADENTQVLLAIVKVSRVLVAT